MRYEFTDHEWVAIKLMLPNKPRCLHRSQQETVRGPVAKRAAPRRIDRIPHAMFARDNGGGIALLLLTPDRRGRTFVAMTTGASSLLARFEKAFSAFGRFTFVVPKLFVILGRFE